MGSRGRIMQQLRNAERQLFKQQTFGQPSQELPPYVKANSENFPQYLFEWHPGKNNPPDGPVYVVRLPGDFHPKDGRLFFDPDLTGKAKSEIIAEHCDTHGRFLGFIQTYLRGYREAAFAANNEDRKMFTDFLIQTNFKPRDT